MANDVQRLRERLATVVNLDHAAAVLGWDQQTYMPPGGARARGEQLATLTRLSHEIFTDQETAHLIDLAEQEVRSLPPESVDAALTRVARRDYDKATRVPASLVAELSRHAVEAHAVWVQARETADFPMFVPSLQRSVELSRELAEALGYEDQPYDALLDQFEPGMKTAQVRDIFTTLRPHLIELVQAVASSPVKMDAGILHQEFDEGKQEHVGRLIATRYGYDFTRGRQDRTVHPFETSFSRDDVRITTRFDKDFLGSSLFSTLHESGHAMYEQGVGEDLEGTPLAQGASLGVHESQSRLWENIVGRSRPFWEYFYPTLQETFPERLGQVPMETFYRAVNIVQPSFIRTEADEVTYNLHIMLRFEMELGMLDGSIPAVDANRVWDDLMDQYLGIRPPNDRLGILQDVHWSGGMLGYFSTYALGNILSAQFYAGALRAHPSIPDEIRQGEFATLRHWLSEHVYRYGRMDEPNTLIERATGSPLTIEPYLQYLRTKFGELYRL
ncbi:MAG TPA: carboxypeptidase M32 [Chloroflexota bacterium]|nr:carboxypeptidase M32 [Chloroflexota bacterium]